MATDVPQTTWRDQSGLGDYSTRGVDNIVDINDNFLVDPDGNNVVDTGVTRTGVPRTVWEENDAV